MSQCLLREARQLQGEPERDNCSRVWLKFVSPDYDEFQWLDEFQSERARAYQEPANTISNTSFRSPARFLRETFFIVRMIITRTRWRDALLKAGCSAGEKHTRRDQCPF